MAIQLPRRRDVRPSRKYARPVTRQMIKPVPGRPDPGVSGGPSAAATPLAFGGGTGLVEAGKSIQALGLQWTKEEAIAQAQRTALLEEAIVIDRIRQFAAMQTAPPTRTAFKQPQLGGIPSSGGGYQGPTMNDPSGRQIIPPTQMKSGSIPWNE